MPTARSGDNILRQGTRRDARLQELTVDEIMVWTPSDTLNIVAGTSIPVTGPIMAIQGSGGAVDMTAVPQVVVGVEGQILKLEGKSDSNTVRIHDGDGLHLHAGPYTMGDHDTIDFLYDSAHNEWDEVSRNSPSSEKAWGFSSPVGSSGIFYIGGYYLDASSANDFSPSTTHGTANGSYAAHFYLVTGVQTSDELTITVSGTSIDDDGNYNNADSEAIVIANATPVDSYYETVKKWLGQVSIVVTSGTPVSCDFGYAKYWDNNNMNFRITGVEVTGFGGATDTAPNFILRHHKGTSGNTAWTYTGTGSATKPTAIADMQADHSTTEDNIINNQPFAYKRANLNEAILGASSEGVLWEVVTTANKAIDISNFLITIRPE